ncbi:MAG: aminoacyl-tRNA hydrolase [Candidatus Margulisiibacteriota bacterium]
MYLIVGLGNPGDEYTDTRHNLGFEAVGRLAKQLGSALKTDKNFEAKAAKTRFGSEQLILITPLTFMNLSGRSVKAASDYYKIPAGQIILVYDDIDLEEGQIRIKLGGGTAGHKGVESVIEHLKSRDFTRVRIGAGRPQKTQAADHVLSKINKSERDRFESASGTAALAVAEIISNGLDQAMNKFNGTSSNADESL